MTPDERLSDRQKAIADTRLDIEVLEIKVDRRIEALYLLQVELRLARERLTALETQEAVS